MFIPALHSFSYFMLLTSNFLLNHMEKSKCLPIYPFVDETCNVVRTNDPLRYSRARLARVSRLWVDLTENLLLYAL